MEFLEGRKALEVYFFKEEPDFVAGLVFEQESPAETGKYQCDCDFIAFTKDGKKVTKFGNVAASEFWGCIEE